MRGSSIVYHSDFIRWLHIIQPEVYPGSHALSGLHRKLKKLTHS